MQAWEPANDIERALVRAVAEDQRSEFFRILTTADLYLPQVTDDGAEGQTFITGAVFGQTVLPVYTSAEAVAALVAGVADAYTITSYAELRDKWPQPEWKLAVNPGLPIDAYLPIEAVEAAARGDLSAVTVAEAIVDGVAEDPQGASALLDVDSALRAAAARGDPDRYVDVLLDAMVLIPTERQVARPDQAILEPGFPWRLAPGAAAPTIQVFSSEEIFLGAYPQQVPSVTMPFAFLLSVWPEGHALSVNPDTELNVELPPDQVQGLLLWAAGGETGAGT